MKKLLLLVSLMMSASAFAHTLGDKIHFQSDSAFISVLGNGNDLCFDGEYFHAKVPVCLKTRTSGADDDITCVKWGKAQSSQPRVSTRLRCAQYDDDRDDCRRYEEIAYIQSPVRTVKFYETDDDSERLVKTEVIEVPSCN